MNDNGQLADRDGFDDFYRASYARLVGQLLAVTGGVATAEDVVQEAFMRALARWPKIVTYDQPEAWVRRVAINLAVSNFRRLRRELGALLRLTHQRPSPSLPQETTALLDVLRQVAPNQRAVLMMHDVLDLPIDDIARELGVPVTTVRGRLSRARAHLREVLGSDQTEEQVRR